MNGKKPLTLDYKTFIKATGLDYNKGTYVSHPSPEAVKAELEKLPLMQTSELLGTEYNQDQKFAFLPGVLSNSNFSKDPSKVTEIELTASMIAVNNQEQSVLPLPFSRKKKKGKSWTVSKPKPKIQGSEASGTLPQKRKKAKTYKTTLEATETPPTEDVPTEDSDKTQSVSSGQTTHPQDTKGNTQPVVKGSHSSLDEGTRKLQPFPKGTTIDPKDSRGNVQPADKGLSSMVPGEGTSKTKPLSEWPHGDKDSEEFKPPADVEPSPTLVADLSGTDAKYQDDQTQSARFEAGDEIDEDIHHTDEEETPSPSPNKDQPKSSHVQETAESDSDSSCPETLYSRLIEDEWEKHKEAAALYADLKSEIEGFHDASYKVHKGIEDVVKEDPALNKKVIKAIEAYTKNSTNLTKLLTLIKIFNLQGLKSLVDSLQASALRQDEHLAAWAKSEISSLKQDTSEIKSMMTKIFKAFKGQSSSAPSSSVPTITLTITEGPATVGRRIYLILQPSFLLKKPLLKLKGRKLKRNQQLSKDSTLNSLDLQNLSPLILSSTSQVAQREGKGIATDETEEPTMKLVHASREVRQDPDEPIRVLYKIHGKIYQLTNNEIQAHLDKEEKIKKAAEEAKLLAMTKSELID
ncbi:hypothetical protein Tco_0098486 [Tanacetum coccineum]